MTANSESLPGRAQLAEAIERFEGTFDREPRHEAAAALVALMHRFSPGWCRDLPTYTYRGQYYQARVGRLCHGPVIDLGDGEVS
jgi:hypothetical protein